MTVTQDGAGLRVPGLSDFAAPLRASDAEVDAAVQEAGLLPLLMAVVHGLAPISASPCQSFPTCS